MRSRLLVRFGRRALAAALLASVCAVGASAQDPTQASDEERAIARAIGTHAAEEPTLEGRLAAVEAAWKTYGESANFALALEIVGQAHEIAREAEPRGPALDSFYAFSERLDRSRLTPAESLHLDYQVGRHKALDGKINEGEGELLRVLAQPREALLPATRAKAHYMLGYCNYYGGQLERAAAHSVRAAEAYLEMGDRLGAMWAYDGAGTTYFALGAVDSALHYARRGLSLAEGIAPGELANLHLNYAEALAASGRIDSAFHYAERADSVIVEGGRFAEMARAQLCLGNLNAVVGRLDVAREHYESSVAHFDLAHEPYHKIDPLDSLRGVLARLGEYEGAYRASIRAFALRDSLRERRVRLDTDRLVAEHERDALARELEASRGERALAQAVISKQRWERYAAAAVFCALASLLAFGVYRGRVRRRHATGLQREVEARTTELRDRQASLELQTRRLEASNAELERFAYIASHDLKTPLRNVTSFLGLIERRLCPEARMEVKEYLDIATANARHMHALVTDVLEFSRLDADLQAISAPVRVAQVVAAAESALRTELEARNARVECVGDADLTLPKGTLEQLLGNLIGNGVKYNRSPRPFVKVVVTELPQRRVRITVSDNGIGIDEEFHDRVFEVFRRLHTSDEFTGTGVGLAVCRKVVDRLGGVIALESAVGQGSTFIVDLPREVVAPTEAPAVRPTRAVAQQA